MVHMLGVTAGSATRNCTRTCDADGVLTAMVPGAGGGCWAGGGGGGHEGGGADDCSDGGGVAAAEMAAAAAAVAMELKLEVVLAARHSLRFGADCGNQSRPTDGTY